MTRILFKPLMPLAAALVLALPGWAQAAADQAEPLSLRFADFFRQPIGPRGLELSETLRQADGRWVRLSGFMVAQEQAQAGQFLLTPRPVRMSEHADGDADDLPAGTVTVLLDAGQQDRMVVHQPGLLSLSGRLSVGRAEDASGRVSWLRLQLGPEALAPGQLGADARSTLPRPPAAAHAH